MNWPFPQQFHLEQSVAPFPVLIACSVVPLHVGQGFHCRECGYRHDPRNSQETRVQKYSKHNIKTYQSSEHFGVPALFPCASVRSIWGLLHFIKVNTLRTWRGVFCNTAIESAAADKDIAVMKQMRKHAAQVQAEVLNGSDLRKCHEKLLGASKTTVSTADFVG